MEYSPGNHIPKTSHYCFSKGSARPRHCPLSSHLDLVDSMLLSHDAELPRPNYYILMTTCGGLRRLTRRWLGPHIIRIILAHIVSPTACWGRPRGRVQWADNNDRGRCGERATCSFMGHIFQNLNLLRWCIKTVLSKKRRDVMTSHIMMTHVPDESHRFTYHF